MTSLKARLTHHLAACSVAAIAACSASAANAAVVYSGVVNFAAAVDIDGTYINVETQQLTSGPGASVPGWDVNPYRASTGSGMNFFGSTGGGMVSAAAGVGSAINLADGTSIGATSNYSSSTSTVVFGSAAGNWQYGTNNLVGFRFVAASGATHYGWMRFLMGSQPATGNLVTRTVVDFGYEPVAGASILVGDNGAPVTPPSTSSVPGPLPLFGITSAFGLSRRLRRRTLQASKQSAPDTTLTSCNPPA
jgi:hypothetical protein